MAITRLNVGTQCEGWAGEKNRTWHSDKELKALLLEDFKAAGIKASIRFHKAGYLTSFTVTVKVRPDEVKSFEEWAPDWKLSHSFGWLWFRDASGKEVSMSVDDWWYKLSDEEREAYKPFLMRSEYEAEVGRLEETGNNKKNGCSVLKDSAAERLAKAVEIVTEYNRDCSDSMTDYFDRDLYDWYCVKVG